MIVISLILIILGIGSKLYANKMDMSENNKAAKLKKVGHRIMWLGVVFLIGSLIVNA